MRVLTYITALLALAALVPSGADATILRVNPQASGPVEDGSSWANAYRSLQPALDAAGPGDEVWLIAGTYNGSFTVNGGTMVLGGFAGTEVTRAERVSEANLTVVDGGNQGVVLTVKPGNFATLIDRLTITHGSPMGLAATEAVLAVNECSITANHTGVAVSGTTAIFKSRISDNAGPYGVTAIGGLQVEDSVISDNDTGIRATGGTTTIRRNTIRRNLGTGVVIESSARTPTIIRENRIERNADGGIRISGGAPQVLNNIVRNNTTEGDGGGIAVTSGSATIVGNVIVGNVSGAMGGGILAGATDPSVTVRITNNTVVNNVAAVRGGGIHVAGSLSGGGTVLIENTVLAYNRGGISRSGGANVQLRHNDVFPNAGAFDGLPDPGPADGNISLEPRFADPFLFDLHIQPDSPLRDAGRNASVEDGTVDIDGQPRIQPGGGTVDIGADESDGTVYSIGRVVIRVKPDGNDANNGSTWELAKKTVQAAVDTAASAGGGEVWVAQGVYNELVTLGSGVHLLGGFQGTEQTSQQADPVAHVTVLEGGKVGSVVTISYGAGGGQSIRGFTIRHQQKSGIGIEVHTASLYLADCILTSNNAGLQSDNAIVTTRFVRIAGNQVGVSGVVSGFLDDAEIQDNTNAGIQVIAPNLSVRYSIIAGNGIGLEAFGTVTVDGNTVLNNTGPYGVRIVGTATVTNNSIRGNGYGIHVSGGRAEKISHNIVTLNRARGIYLEQFAGAQPRLERNVVSGNAGGGIHLSGGMPHVLGNTIRDNTATENGAGIAVLSGGPILANNVVAENESGGAGGGLYLSSKESADFVKVVNNTVAGNRSVSGAGGIQVAGAAPHLGTVFLANNIVVSNSSGIANTGPVNTVLRFNDVFGNGNDYDGIANPTGVDGNVSVDPGFVDPGAHDLHLAPASPLRNAGDTTALQDGWTDIDDTTRRQEVAVDIGADEVAGEWYALPDVRRALQVTAGLAPTDASERARLDVHPRLGANGGPTGDGAVTVQDAIRLLHLLSGRDKP